MTFRPIHRMAKALKAVGHALKEHPFWSAGAAFLSLCALSQITAHKYGWLYLSVPQAVLYANKAADNILGQTLKRGWDFFQIKDRPSL